MHFTHPPSLAKLPEPKLEFLFHLECEIGETLDFGVIPGTGVDRKSCVFSGGVFEGPKLKGHVLPGGADWLVTLPNGTGVPDTRYNLKTENGALIYVQTRGSRVGPKEVLDRIAAGEEVGPDEYRMRLTVQLETGHPDYAWLNTAVIIASAAKSGNLVVYDAYQVL